MQESSTSKTESESTLQSPLFTIGTHVLSHVPRGWERSATSPKKRPQRKGTKVWKRRLQDERDALVSAQLLNDLATSLKIHAAKRQRTGQAPEAPVILRKEAFYNPTLSDTPNSVRRRKPAARRQSARSPVKSLTRTDGWLSPTEVPETSVDLLCAPENAANSSIAISQAFPTTNGEMTSETSFLDLIDVSRSTMFDNESSSETEELDTSSDDDATIDLGEEGSDGAHGNAYNICLDVDADVDADASSDGSEDEEGVARLADAGNTGVIRVEYTNEFDDLDLDDIQGGAQASDMSPMQMHVASLLRSPLKVTEVMEDRAPVISAAIESDAPTITPSDSFTSDKSPTPTLGREDTTSTVAFEDLDVSGLLFGTEPSRSTSAKRMLSDTFNEQDSQEAVLSAAIKSRIQSVQSTVFGSSSVGKPTASERKVERLSSEDSADELDGGTPTQRKVIRSPKKNFAAIDVSPTKLKSVFHISDDTTYLNEFLSRARSQAAARAQDLARSPVKLPTKRQSPRIVLGTLDTNSPSPSPAGRSRASFSKENSKRDHVMQGEMDSPTKLPKTPAARMLLAGSADSPETPDELSSAPPPPPMRSDLTEDNLSTRRSGRSRLPAPSRLPASAPSNIPLRRADGEPPVLLPTEAQTLARTTAANTRRNKGGARFPKQVIEILDAKDLSPVKPRGTVKNRKGRNVDWDHRLVYFLEDTGKEVEIDADGKLIEKENGEEVKRRVRIVKGEKVVSKEEETEVHLKVDDTKEAKPDQDHGAQRITKAPRRIKSASTKSFTFELPDSSSTPVVEDQKPSLAKPRRAKGSTTLIGLKGTPAVRRMLSVEINNPIMSAAKRRSRPT